MSLWQSLLLLLVLAAGPAAAEERAYDLLGRLLHPYAALLADGGDEARALTLTVRIEESRGFTMDLSGQRAEVQVQYPDKLKLHAPLLGEEYTPLPSRRDALGVSGLKAARPPGAPEIAKRLPEPDRKFQLRPFRLPVSQKELVFLPALFQAKTAPDEAVAGQRCQVLDLQATPLLAQALDLRAWSARLWLEAQLRPARFSVTGPATKVSGAVEKADFARALPPETWVPTKEQEGDVVLVPPVRYDQLMRAILGLK